MKRKHYLLDLFNGVDDCFVMEAIGSRESARPAAGRNRMILIAAAIALAALLVGCGIVYVLNMQNLKLGNQQITQERWDNENTEMVEETVNLQVLTLSGIKGTSYYQAALDWYEFMHSYDPDGSIQMATNCDELHIWGDYDFYSPYSQVMVDKIDEIAKTYNLTLLGPWVVQNGNESVLSNLGIKSLLTKNANAISENISISATENGHFHADFTIHPTDQNNAWPYMPIVSYFYTPRDCFNPAIIELNDTGDWEEEKYTTAAGNHLLILRSPSDWRSWIFCDRIDAMVYLRMETIWEVYSDDGVIQQPMTNAELHEILDLIDFSLTPHNYQETDSHKPGPAVGESQAQNGYTLEVRSIFTDGSNVRIIFGLTVPESVKLYKEDCIYGASFGNFGSNSVLTPVVEDDYQWMARGETMNVVEDPNGQDNTIQIIYETYAYPWVGDETFCYKPGSSWKIRVQNIGLERLEYPSGTYAGTVPLGTAEGNWEFDITIPEDTDTRVIEFIDAPVTFEARSGGWWAPLRNVTITSFQLSSLKADIMWKDDLYGALEDQQQETCVVLKDGSRIPLDGGDYWIGKNFAPIPLDEVDYVELFNGIKLYPQN